MIIGVSMVLSATLIAGGVAHAAGASITACAKKKGGAMRLITSGTCKKTENTITWGASGESGATGATGAAGSNGSNGYSKVYIGGGDSLTYAPGYAAAPAAGISLPKGKYLVSFTMQVGLANTDETYASHPSTTPHYLACNFAKTRTPASDSDYLWPVRGRSDLFRASIDSHNGSYYTDHGMQLVSGTFPLSLDSATNVFLLCSHEAELGESPFLLIYSGIPTLTATEVNEIVVPEN